jgi:hypothetical protein
LNQTEAMISFTPEQTKKLLQNTAYKQMCSDCGYFSKPFRVEGEQGELIVKTFLPIRKRTLVDFILQNHQEYIDELKATGIRLPDTFITSIPQYNKHQVVIVQEPFRDEELLRGIIANASLQEIKDLCDLLFADTLKFCYRKKGSLKIGFHPSLRNYALRDSQLWYIDTFPPMLMDQKKLNRIIIAMSPYGRLIKKITHPRIINKVSNEYYFIDRMFSGIIGSCCRLHPELSEEILQYSKEYVANSPEISPADKTAILRLLKSPPSLSKLWVTWRRLSGNTGKPNV